MVRFDDILILESPYDYAESAISWDDGEYIRLHSGVVLPKPQNDVFPKYYQCGKVSKVYFWLTKEEFTRIIQEKISKAQQEVDYLKMIDYEFS